MKPASAVGQTGRKGVRDLAERAGVEADELGPEPVGGVATWREGSRGTAVLLAGLADWDPRVVVPAAMWASGMTGNFFQDAVAEYDT